MNGNNWEQLTSFLKLSPLHNAHLMRLLVNLNKQSLDDPREKQILTLVTCVAFKHIAHKLPLNFMVVNADYYIFDVRAQKYKSEFDVTIDDKNFYENLPEIVNTIADELIIELDEMIKNKILNNCLSVLVQTGEKGFRDLQIVIGI
jgi:hypothetical protein